MPGVFVSTERLDLIPFREGDVDDYHRVWGDPEVIWWGASPGREASAGALARLVARITEMPDGMDWWWLRRRDDGVVVGDVCLQQAPEPFGGVEIGWHLAREHFGFGYATEGATPLLSHSWEIGLDEVIATIVPMNLPSVRVAERLGMVRRGPTLPRSNLAHGVWVAVRP
ncbi:GNAT family N-acetyltransferase [bacterium]|nr:GNAT family N-acetyltransferase [bacterium]